MVSWATRLTDGQPLADVVVSIMPSKNATATTSAQGVADFQARRLGWFGASAGSKWSRLSVYSRGYVVVERQLKLDARSNQESS